MTPYARKLLESGLLEEKVNSLIVASHPFDCSVFSTNTEAAAMLRDTTRYLMDLTIKAKGTDQQLFFPGQRLWLESAGSGQKVKFSPEQRALNPDESALIRSCTIYTGYLIEADKELKSCKMHIFSSAIKKNKFYGNGVNNLTNRIVTRRKPASLDEIRLATLDIERRTRQGYFYVESQLNPLETITGESSAHRLLTFYQMMAVIWLINSPSICTVYERNHSRSAQKRWRSWGRYPLNGWSEIKIRLDAIGAIKKANAKDCHGRRAKHWVRGHLRTLTTGQKTMVKPHWRGDETLGVIRSKYKAISAAEKQ